jgi:transglutaminase-like putative cysteine protease
VTSVVARWEGALKVDEDRSAVEAAANVADPYLRSTDAIDWTSAEILRLARDLGEGSADATEIARRCFERVRDQIAHTVDHGHEVVTFSASEVLREKTGFCYAKSHLLAALLRANGIRAGLAYQRLALDSEGHAFCLHGLAVVDLPGYGWYRVDPRGNKPGVDARFTPPREHLAFPASQTGEVMFPKVYADPVGPVVRALKLYRSAAVLSACLPDAVTESELER